MLKPHWAQVEEDATQWLAAVSGTTSVRPLSGDALRLAFTYFDKDATGLVTLVQLESGMQTVMAWPCLALPARRHARARATARMRADKSDSTAPPVSYTHLTLPTILLV